MNYWEARKVVKNIIPRMSKFFGGKTKHSLQEKGRKSNYHQFSFSSGKMEKIERLLNKDQIDNFVEVSLRAQSCPMPFNIDIYDGLKCPYRCRYCFADYFRHSLYTSFFDNPKEMGIRHCNVEKYRSELEKLFKHRGEKVEGNNEVLNAVRLEIPLRLGIQFEDFTAVEKRKGISLQLLKFLKDNDYPTMINTKSDILQGDEYVKALSENKGKGAVHFTLISSDEKFLKLVEPGAPTFRNRLKAAKALSSAGVRVVARWEPWMIFLNDDKNMVDEYIEAIKEAGIKHMTFDSYSYSAKGRGLAQNFYDIGMDFQRMFLLSSDSQGLSSMMLGKFMDYFQENGIECSTFDQGNVAKNDDWICCAVGDWFEGGFNLGSGVTAIRYILRRNKKPTQWSDFRNFVEKQGGFLSDNLKRSVHMLWNGEGDAAWPIYWGQGITPIGNDEDGIIWKYDSEYDFRENIFKGVIG